METFYSIFGGQDKYEALPVLEFNITKPLEPEHMTAPIMRGQDDVGRFFVTIRGKRDDHDTLVQTFFRPTMNDLLPYIEDLGESYQLLNASWLRGMHYVWLPGLIKTGRTIVNNITLC